MLLKSTFVPLFTAIPARGHPGKLSVSSVRNVVAQRCPPTSRQNGSSNTTSLLLLHKLSPTSAYVHLPFCRKRCHYCDFPIIALGSSSSNPGDDKDDPRILNYLETLCREIKATKLDSANTPPLETVFFGGGTPSLVPPRLVSSVLDALSYKFGVCSNAEISMEMDPGTFGEGKLKELMNLGVNRVSLGVQAFQEELLKACGRAHGVREVYEAIKIVKSCGVENWSVDLISSLPHQTLSIWEQSLQLTIQAQPTHVSVYDLQVEQETKFGVLYSPGEFPLPSENQSAEFYRVASRMLRDAGYDHYEISSYCKTGYRCKHNSTYWKNKPFYAFGMGSASYVDGVRFSRPRRLKEYMDYVQNLENGLTNCSEDDIFDAKDLAMDVVMLSLRTADGLDLKSFKEAFGDPNILSICEVYRPHVESGHVICLDGQGRTIAVNEFLSSFSNEFWRNEKLAYLRLSDPDGFLLSNELISLAFGAIAP
ncbi:UNVERIFIED_CONTAM: Heme chaperone HemW [Sesamum latifolium]|uniref:Radical S-adenosyl methionine domain-containing protein 1, mitochondrial n=1 Tax=Sesamum latifolium TaxID=2727402 RepID=A0AAW2UEG5_9LAMI